ncbi:MAG: T9SS type A sorting domain-containing protein [Lewinellaceae bacterium]|nr:T9SS type A sorting domain-containing protein [Lewinellaceae bacterium]
MNSVRIFTFLLASFIFSFTAKAQTPICLDFEEIPIGTIYSPATGYAPGDSIFTEESVAVSVQEFDQGNGNMAFGSTVALDVPPNFTIGSGVVLLTNNMNLSFDFSGVSGPLLGIAFGFLDGGGLENLSVNGGDLFVVESFSQLPTTVAPGVTAQVIFLPGVTPPVGTVILQGPVQSLTVGGQELVLDNFCFLIEEPNPDCVLANLTATPQDCNGVGQYQTLVDFDHENNSAAGFNLFLDGQLYGAYFYDELPITLDPLFGNGWTVHQVEIVDLANPDCSISGEFGPVDCSSACLQFEGLEVGTVYGDAGGNSPGDLLFTEAEVPVSIHEFSVNDSTVVFGNAFVENDPFQTAPSIDENYLYASNINLDFDFTGLATDVYAVRFGFAEQGGVINFQVNEGDLYIVEHLADLPMEVAPGVTASVQVVTTPGGAWGWVLLEGPVATLSVGGQELSLDNFCYYQVPPCHIYDLVVETTACENGSFYAILNFQYENVSNEGFTVQGNGVNYGNFNYSEVPLTLGPLAGDGTTPYEFVVTDLVHPDCSDFVDLGTIDCTPEPCNIYDLTVETTPCENGQFYAILNFQYQNVGNQGFKVQGNGVLYGTFEYADLPVTIGPLAGDGTTVYEFSVRDVAHPDCHDVTFTGPVDCGAGPCEIYDLVVETGECNGDGAYSLFINFQVDNPGNDHFEVFYNGQNIGYFLLADLPVTIENFSDNGEQVVHLTFCINDMPDCCKVAEFPSPCPGSPCNIYDLTAETTPCENGQFYVILNFQYENVGGEGFKVVGNGNNYGVFEYGNLPITLGPFLGDGTTVYEFGVSDVLHPDCHDAIAIDPVDCGGSPCEIYDLVVEPGECNGDGAYNLFINFQVDNPGNDFFEVYYGTENLGFFALADLPITIENFSDNGEEVVHIKVCINDMPNCCKVAEFLSPCPSAGCNIYDLTAETTPCENGQFYVILNFQYENVGNQGFKVQGNGNMYGTFDYSQVPVTIGPLVGDGTTVYEFAVKDVAHPDCHDVTFTGPVDCGAGPCEIYDLVVDPGECNANGAYNLFINFQVDNPGNDFFEVFYNDQNIGFFALADLPVVIENFSDNGEEVVHITVCINDVLPHCCKLAEFLSPCPGGNVWPGDANSDNIANNIDLLNLGMAFGATGPERAQTSIAWEPWPSANWMASFPNGVNYKHADCDGSGNIDATDQSAIELNYNETHGAPLPVVYSDGNLEDPPLYADLPEQGVLGPGDAFEIPIILGTHELQVDNIYGIAFTLHFDPDLIDPSSVNLEYPVSWMGAPGVNAIVLDKKFVEEGVIEVALSRIDGNNVSGFGPIMAFIGIIDDVLGKHEMKIEFTKVRAIMSNDAIVDLQFPEETVVITSAKEIVPQTEGITVFPNPTNNEIRWMLNSVHQTEYAAIIDVNGRVLDEQYSAHTSLPVSELPAGMYWLKVQAGDQVYISRFVKM